MSDLDEFLGRRDGKPVADKTIARHLGDWLARKGAKGLVIFGASALFYVTVHGEFNLPVIFNNFFWTASTIEAVQAAYRAYRARKGRKDQNGIAVTFLGGEKPPEE